MIPHTVGKWRSAGGANFPMSGHWRTRGRGFWMSASLWWRCRVGPRLRFPSRPNREVYVGWSFCRAEMSKGGGARPLHSFSCPSLKRRLRAGRGTPDSAGGWLRGFDTPLSMSEGWAVSCKHKGQMSQIRTSGRADEIRGGRIHLSGIK